MINKVFQRDLFEIAALCIVTCFLLFRGSIGVALSALRGGNESADTVQRKALNDILSDDISEIEVEVEL